MNSDRTPSTESIQVPFDADREEARKAKQQWLEKRRKESLTTHHGQQRNKDDQEWKFFDTAKIHVSGGDGGNGYVNSPFGVWSVGIGIVLARGILTRR